MPDFTYDVGRVSFIMKGAWNLATNYEKLDAVTYDGSLYIAKQDVPGGTAITNTTYWQLAAEKGDKGDTGGVNSVNGQQGDVWFPDSRQLISDGYTTDTEPFLMKGNDSDSDRFELAKKLGNTVAVNQLVPINAIPTKTSVGITLTSNNDGTYTLNGTATGTFTTNSYAPDIPSGHKVLVQGSHVQVLEGSTSLYGDVSTGVIVDSGGDLKIRFRVASGTTLSSLKSRPIVRDLTLWFGSNDRIPSDLLSHPENWGRYYAGSLDYNAGTLESADGTAMRSIGRNVWDEKWEVGGINLSTGQNVWADNKIRSTNYIPVIPNTAYYAKAKLTNGVLFYGADKTFLGQNYVAYPNNSTFTTPSNAYYMRFVVSDTYGTTYNHDLTISLYYPGESGYDQYYPYQVLAEVDTGSEVLRSAGSVADEKTPDGTITRRVGYVDLGTLNWTAISRTRFETSSPISGLKYNPSAIQLSNIHCGRYETVTFNTIYQTDTDKCISAYNESAYIQVRDTSYATAAAFKTAMSGVYLYYELATPTTEQGTAFEPLVVTVKNGVLSWTNTKGIPVGQESHWFENLRKRVEDRLPDPPSVDGTYRLTCTITGGVKTYSWEA